MAVAAAEGCTECRLCGRAFEQYGSAHHLYCKRCTAKADERIAKTPAAKCGMCGKKFFAARRSAKYCSDACRADSRRRYGREYQRMYAADPEKRAIKLARARVSIAARRARIRGDKPPPRWGRDAGSMPSTKSGTKSSVCGLCGRMFAPYGGTHHACCKRCTAKADSEIGRVWRVDCKECGKKFSTSSRRVCYCSDECRTMGKRASDREYMRRRAADPERRAERAAYERARAADRRARVRAEWHGQ